MIRLLDDAYLKPYENAIRARARRASGRAVDLTGPGGSLVDWANAHRHFGLHRTAAGWVFREWAPGATEMGLVGDFNRWTLSSDWFAKRRPGTDEWELKLPPGAIRPGDRYHLEMRWPGGRGERIPAFADHVLQDPRTGLFEACVFESRYVWRNRPCPLRRPTGALRIYEAHVGMGTEEEKVGSYDEFRRDRLREIKRAGYDTVQLMAIMEHPYYGSFGYHVSSFFAASSRFGSPDDLKALVDEAHGLGLRVIMDLVHSHAVANERDGLSRFDGTDYQYFHSGDRGRHPAWGSRCFDYGKTQVLHFLLSNCKYWLEEYDFDGFRFDGVTSMLFHDHGLGRAFTDYSMYFGDAVDADAWTYLQLANRLIHALKPSAVTIAEDVSGLPGVAARAADCGIGFDYRMAMGEPDFWFRLAEKVRDEDWSVGEIYRALTDKRREERVVSYVESHDQALVGGKTFLFQCVDREIYFAMRKDQPNPVIERGLALHKLARLATASLQGGAYLTFMGNEFGHPEWIDFPREGNGWSYRHARRLWHLRDDPELRFGALAAFETEFLKAIAVGEPIRLVANEADKVLAYLRGPYLYVFNFHPVNGYSGYGVPVPPATAWREVFDSDETRFGGCGRLGPKRLFRPILVRDTGKNEWIAQIRLDLPARTAVVLKRVPRSRPVHGSGA